MFGFDELDDFDLWPQSDELPERRIYEEEVEAELYHRTSACPSLTSAIIDDNFDVGW